MKKILILLLTTVIASLVQAGSIDWKTPVLYFDGARLSNNLNVYGCLIYLESGSLESSYVLDNNFAPANLGPIVSEDTDGTPRSSIINGTFNFDNGNPYYNGDVFGLLISYNDGVDTWWNLSADTRVIEDLSMDITSPGKNWTQYSLSYEKGTDGTLVAGGGWVKVPAVPEPATASLALLGVALLIKRRRA